MLAQFALILLISFVAGVVLIGLGLRGKRINTHPTCRDCSFDLIAIQGAITCPECGAGLRRPKAIRIGQRRKRPLFLALGALLVVLPLAPIGGALYAFFAGKDIYAWKPLGLLLWEANRAGATEMPLIASEMLRRFNADSLDQHQRELIVAKALSIQADESRPWSMPWGDIIDQAQTDGLLTKEQRSEYQRNAIALKADVRPRLRPGDPLQLKLSLKECRIAGTAIFDSILWLKEAKLAGQPLTGTMPDRMHASVLARDNTHLAFWSIAGPSAAPLRTFFDPQEQVVYVKFRVPQDLPPGRHALDLIVVTKTSAQRQGLRTGVSLAEPKGETARQHHLNLLVDVLPLDAQMIERIPATPEFDALLKEALRSPPIIVHNGLAAQTFVLHDVPVPIAFDVIWKAGNVEWQAGSISMGESETAYPYRDKSSRTVSIRAVGFVGMKYDVVLRTSEKALLSTLDQTRMYDGEIVFEGVPVIRQ